MQSSQNVEEKVVSKAVEATLGVVFDDVEDIDIDIQTDFLKLFQGQVDSVAVEGQGLSMQGVRVSEVQMQTDSISVNPLNAVFGKVQLDKPVNANARLVFTEDDLNRALTSNFVKSKIQGFDLSVNGEVVSFKPQVIRIELPSPNKLKIVGKILLQERGATRPLTFQAVARHRTDSSPIILESFVCAEDEGVSLELATALMQKIRELTQLPYLQIEGLAFRVKKMQVEKGKMTLLVQVHLRKMPSM
jgi:LmeA-like phospholipid-binding